MGSLNDSKGDLGVKWRLSIRPCGRLGLTEIKKRPLWDFGFYKVMDIE